MVFYQRDISPASSFFSFGFAGRSAPLLNAVAAMAPSSPALLNGFTIEKSLEILDPGLGLGRDKKARIRFPRRGLETQ